MRSYTNVASGLLVMRRDLNLGWAVCFEGELMMIREMVMIPWVVMRNDYSRIVGSLEGGSGELHFS